MDDRRTVRLLISGRVQGVWYRGWTVEQASRLGLDGWVRNLADGRVEALCSGAPAAIDKMIMACRDGPPAARVTGVAVSDLAETPPPGFQQRASA